MSTPLLTIIIPTHNRPKLVLDAVRSALEQTFQDLEILVVDDASTEPIRLPNHPKVRLIRLSSGRGGAGARNAGTEAARGRWITYLDDDDRLLPHMAQVSLEALEKATLPSPVGVISGIEVVNAEGEVIGKRFPPPYRPRGAHFFLEDLEPEKSYNTKQTLVVEREIIRQIGGWDEAFRSRVHSDLFLRLNSVCSLVGIETITYQLYAHENTRVSRNRALRQESFNCLVDKHKDLFEAHPKMFAHFLYQHAQISFEIGQKQAALSCLYRAMKLAPVDTLGRIISIYLFSGITQTILKRYRDRTTNLFNKYQP
ncbi:MAG: glycosyltransferase [Hydrococcus sp. Prado102]|jgi:glycosyltransferase involved in cell wall biosynthesis|nr:glycosyltransferase [Hydrococcus sp. Prado102]